MRGPSHANTRSSIMFGGKMKENYANEGMTTAQAATIMGISAGSLNNMRSRKAGPKYFKIGKSIRYLRLDVIKYINDRTIDPERS